MKKVFVFALFFVSACGRGHVRYHDRNISQDQNEQVSQQPVLSDQRVTCSGIMNTSDRKEYSYESLFKLTGETDVTASVDCSCGNSSFDANYLVSDPNALIGFAKVSVGKYFVETYKFSFDRTNQALHVTINDNTSLTIKDDCEVEND